MSRSFSVAPTSGATASSVATSSAADELRPLPTGTSDHTSSRSPWRSGLPSSAWRTTSAPAAYAAHARRGSPVSSARARSYVERALGDERRRAASVTVASPPSARMSSLSITTSGSSLGLRRHPGRRGDRHLEHQRAGVVGDAAHHVEPSRRARERDGTIAIEELGARGTHASARGSHSSSGHSSPASTSASASWREQTRARAAPRATRDRPALGLPRWRRPTNATSVNTSSGAASRPPAGSVDDHAGLARDQLRAQVVGVAADPERAAARASIGSISGPQLGHPAVVAHRQLVELAGVRDVLVLERQRASLDRRAEHPPPPPRRRSRPARRARPGRSARRRRSPASMVGGARRPQRQRRGARR